MKSMAPLVNCFISTDTSAHAHYATIMHCARRFWINITTTLPCFLLRFPCIIFAGIICVTKRKHLCNVYKYSTIFDHLLPFSPPSAARDVFDEITQRKMSQLDLGGCKKRKRSERVYKFKSFFQRGCPVEFNGSLHENVRALLELGRVEAGLCGKMPIWSFQLEVCRDPLLHLFLLVVEEPVELSLELHCKHCQYVGWGHHMICNKKYHFLLPSSKAGEFCKSKVIELHENLGHIMHGVFHSNGFGHLLCINGSENGSELSGYQIMDFWDRLCSGLGARKVSLRDVARKKGMDLRLLHALAYGKTWFGHWDYVFGCGSYNINRETYENAVNSIRKIPLNLLPQNTGFHNEIIRYQFLSGHSLTTLADLFHFMLDLKHRIPKETGGGDYMRANLPAIMSDSSCRWSPKRVEMAIHVVVETLKRAEFRWVSRQHVRDVARAYIGDTGLLDFVLKSLGNQRVGKYFVRRCLNPVTKVLEYCLEDVTQAPPKQESFHVIKTQKKMTSQSQLTKDLFHMYKAILRKPQNVIAGNGVLSTITMASRVILDTKYLVKDYQEYVTTSSDESRTREVHCSVVLTSNESIRQEAETPTHRFVLGTDATFHELRLKAEETFREMYFGLSNANEGYSIRFLSPRETDTVFNLVKPGSKIVFEVKQSGEAIVEGQPMVNVDCVCGCKDDDGERMVLCDVCQVSEHTRCAGIPDSEGIPGIYLCNNCERDVLRFSSLQ